MTLRELLHSVGFEEIAAIIRKSKDGKQLAKAYRKTYDILLSLPKYENCQDIEVVIERDEDDGLLRPWASVLEGVKWESVIDGSLVYVEKDGKIADFSMAQIAYQLLWHMTFFGFTPEQKEEYIWHMMNGDEVRNCWGERAREVNLKRKLVFASPEVREHIENSIRHFDSEGQTMYALTMEDWIAIDKAREDASLELRLIDWFLTIEEAILTFLGNRTKQSPIEGYRYRYRLVR